MPPDQALIETLQKRFGERFSDARGVREQHGRDLSHFPPAAPDAVVFPLSAEEVRFAIEACALARSPIIPFGAGTSLEGHIHAVRGGVTLDMSQMNKILAVHRDDMDAVVQPGVTRLQLNDHLRDSGLFFPIDPGADATIGGMASTRASGTNAVRYGTMKENVLALEVVTASGEIIRTGRRARKSAAGYDLTSLFIGAEGTLGVITEITLRLKGAPEKILAAVCPFRDARNAIQSVIETIQMGVPMAKIEFLDESCIDAVNHASHEKLQRTPTLFIEFQGTERAVEEQVEITREIMTEYGGGDFRWAAKPEERSALWKARHQAAHSISAFATGTRQWWTDVCVPISRLADCIVETRADVAATGLFAPMLGHVGDGNFHLCICAREGDNGDAEKAEALHDRLIARALSVGGTCTGEHGVGQGKRVYLQEEHGSAVDVMRRIKSALDPHDLFNPGKIFLPS